MFVLFFEESKMLCFLDIQMKVTIQLTSVICVICKGHFEASLWDIALVTLSLETLRSHDV